MKSINKMFCVFLFSATSVVALSSCALFQDGNIDDYTGIYISGTGTEVTKHYYWGNTTIKGEKQSMQSGCIITVYSNKKVTLQYPNGGDIITGKIRVYSDHATFKDLNFDSSYKFVMKSDHSLSYTYYQDLMQI